MKVAIVGNTEFSEYLYGYINKESDLSVVAFTVEKEYINETTLCGVPVISLEELSNFYEPAEIKLIMSVGYKNMNRVKEKLFMLYREKGYDFMNYIHPTAIVPEDFKMGTANVILEGVIIERNCKMGNCNLLMGGCLLGHHLIMENCNMISVNATSAGYVHIGSNCFIGANATLRDHVNISNFALIGASAYADRDIRENCVLMAPKSIILKNKISTDYF